MYKPGYTKDEMQELYAWFRARMDRLPQKLKIDKAMSTNNLPRTVDALIQALEKRNISSTQAGLATTLFNIRERLIEDGFEQ